MARNVVTEAATRSLAERIDTHRPASRHDDANPSHTRSARALPALRARDRPGERGHAVHARTVALARHRLPLSRGRRSRCSASVRRWALCSLGDRMSN